MHVSFNKGKEKWIEEKYSKLQMSLLLLNSTVQVCLLATRELCKEAGTALFTVLPHHPTVRESLWSRHKPSASVSSTLK